MVYDTSTHTLYSVTAKFGPPPPPDPKTPPARALPPRTDDPRQLRIAGNSGPLNHWRLIRPKLIGHTDTRAHRKFSAPDFRIARRTTRKAKLCVRLWLELVLGHLPRLVSELATGLVIASFRRARYAANRERDAHSVESSGSRVGGGFLGNGQEPSLRACATGLNVTEMVQSAPGSSVAPQSFVWLKSPPAVMFEIGMAASPELVNVTVWALLLVATTCAEKTSEEEENLAMVATAMGVDATGELSGVKAGWSGRRGPTPTGETLPPDVTGVPGSGTVGGGRASGGFGPDVKTAGTTVTNRGEETPPWGYGFTTMIG